MPALEKCPYKVTTGSGEVMCFDPALVACVRRHPNIVARFCEDNFEECPFYRVLSSRQEASWAG